MHVWVCVWVYTHTQTHTNMWHDSNFLINPHITKIQTLACPCAQSDVVSISVALVFIHVTGCNGNVKSLKGCLPQSDQDVRNTLSYFIPCDSHDCVHCIYKERHVKATLNTALILWGRRILLHYIACVHVRSHDIMDPITKKFHFSHDQM